MSFPLGRTHQRFGSLAGLVLAGFVISACAGRSGDTSGGQARVAVSGSALSSSVASVTLTIGPGDGPTFTPIVEPLTQSGSQWTVFVSGIPAGPGRSFAVAAKDAGGNVLLSGSAKADVVTGGTATVVITLNGSSGPIFSNQAPVMDYLTASQTVVDPGGTVRLGASAHDPDTGDTITYQWAATCGSFDQA
ncbi:MAG TPA: hypothetical protein VFG59_04860, partial [Anaeromyxobacter sp.]|nr:hypothetical protein [Anaeromyxobacter sp.]